MPPGTVAPSFASEGQKYALVVGVDRYEQAQISPLQFAGADAVAVARALREVAGFDPRNVILMTSGGGESPTSTRILARLVGMKAVIEPGDTFVFYFSGHGVEKDEERYLLTADTNPSDVTLLRKSALGAKEVQKVLREMKASRILQLVDACASDPGELAVPGKDPTQQRKQTDNFSKGFIVTQRGDGSVFDAAVTVFSCKVGQKSYEWADR